MDGHQRRPVCCCLIFLLAQRPVSPALLGAGAGLDNHSPTNANDPRHRRWFFPALGVAAAGAELHLGATVGIFVVSGLLLQRGEMLTALRSTAALAYGLVAILAATPLLALAVLRLPLQPPEMALGLAVIEPPFCCPLVSLAGSCMAWERCCSSAGVSMFMSGKLTSKLTWEVLGRHGTGAGPTRCLAVGQARATA